VRVKYLSVLALSIATPQLALAQGVPAPTVSSEPIDPARLEAAQRVVIRILPDGTYAKIMAASMDLIMKSATDAIGNMPLAQLAQIGGLEQEEVARLGDGKLKELMAIIDPAFDQRTNLMMKSMMGSMTEMMTAMEPSVRVGLNRAFARRYSLDQLNDLNRFFDTPTGQKYAADTMLIYTDPEVMAAMQAMMPKLMEQMPEMMREMQAETAALPKPREWEDLSRADREKFAGLLGTTVSAIESDRAKRQRRH
jgi:hypothetical protein